GVAPAAVARFDERGLGAGGRAAADRARRAEQEETPPHGAYVCNHATRQGASGFGCAARHTLGNMRGLVPAPTSPRHRRPIVSRRLTMCSLVTLLAGCNNFTPPTIPAPASGPAPDTTIASGPRARTRLTTATLELQATDATAT